MSKRNQLCVKPVRVSTLYFDWSALSFFLDLAKQTLDCRRALTPLNDKLCSNAIAYHWGFPACLIATKDSRTATLWFPKDLEKFCLDLKITPPERLEWQEDIPILEPSPDGIKSHVKDRKSVV